MDHEHPGRVPQSDWTGKRCTKEDSAVHCEGRKRNDERCNAERRGGGSCSTRCNAGRTSSRGQRTSLCTSAHQAAPCPSTVPPPCSVMLCAPGRLRRYAPLPKTEAAGAFPHHDRGAQRMRPRSSVTLFAGRANGAVRYLTGPVISAAWLPVGHTWHCAARFTRAGS